jgi:hypothetical protein
MCKSSSLFPINNDFSQDSVEDSESNFEDEEVDNLHLSQKVSHARSCHDEDFGLRVNSKRGEFAQRYLFKSGFRNSHNVQQERDAQLQRESTLSEQEYTYCSEESVADCSMNLSANVVVNSTSVEGKLLEYIPESFEEEESVSYNHNAINTNDMFFSCCDWEALR